MPWRQEQSRCVLAAHIVNTVSPVTSVFSKLYKIIICDKKSCVWILFCEFYEHQQRVKYDVHTTSKIKHARHFYHILFLLPIYVRF